eukprot:TRINITY_DN9889_c0_g1_i4.p1 TRINITY_DN9889_c0_g1~~TRINITY_DN9889_c0_g1_i4.p1  ORF type:complete len:241 (-),score=62.69 TRINITY_DN9889_c0_g1_i4:3-725(-)
MKRRPPRSTQSRSSAASDVYKRQLTNLLAGVLRTPNEKEELVLDEEKEIQRCIELSKKFARENKIAEVEGTDEFSTWEMKKLVRDLVEKEIRSDCMTNYEQVDCGQKTSFNLVTVNENDWTLQNGRVNFSVFQAEDVVYADVGPMIVILNGAASRRIKEALATNEKNVVIELTRWAFDPSKRVIFSFFGAESKHNITFHECLTIEQVNEPTPRVYKVAGTQEQVKNVLNYLEREFENSLI